MILQKIDTFLGPNKSRAEQTELLNAVFVLKAWKKLSADKKIIDTLSFDSFCKDTPSIEKMREVFFELSRSFNLFRLYAPPKDISNEALVFMMELALNDDSSERVDEIFFKINSDNSLLAQPQIAKLGLGVLNPTDKGVYVPYANTFQAPFLYDYKIYADSPNPYMAILAELINILWDKNIEFSVCDPLYEPLFLDPLAQNSLMRFDNVLGLYPIALKGSIDISKDKYGRFVFHSGSSLDIALFEHALSQTKNRAVIFSAVGMSFRGGGANSLRKDLIGKNYIDAVIQLPPNLFNATSIETTLFVIDKNKKTEDVFFVNLKDERFIARDRKKLILKDIDQILKIYADKSTIEGISRFVSKEDIEKYDYSLAIDRYITPTQTKGAKEMLLEYRLVRLENIADVRRSQLFGDEDGGEAVGEISPSDFARAGFTLRFQKTKRIDTSKKSFQTYKLEPYDILLSSKGVIGKVGILGEIASLAVASQAITVIRIKGENKKESAIVLYMFLKSASATAILSSLVLGKAMPQISTDTIKSLMAPSLDEDKKSQIIKRFEEEVKLYEKLFVIEKEILDLHRRF